MGLGQDLGFAADDGETACSGERDGGRRDGDDAARCEDFGADDEVGGGVGGEEVAYECGDRGFGGEIVGCCD